MNKNIIELFEIIDANIGNNDQKINNKVFKDDQLEIIKNFIEDYSKSGLFFPYPLKTR